MQSLKLVLDSVMHMHYIYALCICTYYTGGEVQRQNQRRTGRKAPTRELADAIVSTRTQVGFTQAALSRFLNKNIVTVGRWERAEITPQPAVLAQLLRIAPREVAHVFERYLGKTRDQMLFEEFQALSSRPPSEDPDWGKEPIKYSNDIYFALHERCYWMWGEARDGNLSAAQFLVKMLNHSVTYTGKLNRIRRGKQ